MAAKMEKLTAIDVLNFIDDIYDKSPKEILEFWDRYKADYPHMTKKDHLLLGKNWDKLEILAMQAQYVN